LPITARYRIIAVWRCGFMALCQFVLGIRYRVIGRENIPAEPSVVLAKHQSAWETVGLQEVFPPLVFVLKKELLRVPFFGWGLAAMKMISIDRAAAKDALKQVFDQGRERLSAGYWVVIFPEGTRVAPGKRVATSPAARTWPSAVVPGGAGGAQRRGNLGEGPPGSSRRADHRQHRPADRPGGQDGGEDQPWPPPGSRPRCSDSRRTATRMPADARRRLNCPARSGRRACGETLRTIALGEHTVLRAAPGQAPHHRALDRPPRPARRRPRGASLREVEASILQHREWIRSKLDEWQARPHPEPLRIVDGVQIPLLGSPITVRLAIGARRCVWNPQTPERALTLCLRSPAEAPLLLEKALRERASALFVERLGHYASRLGVALPRLSLSSARTRWGSCSLRSGIRLNWRLIHFPLPVIDYVAVHELAHLREMNHSARFWAILAGLYPDYRAARQELKRLATTCPHW
jgi:1-acyl-sn-glycerol-3-phosphate acyltransferase